MCSRSQILSRCREHREDRTGGRHIGSGSCRSRSLRICLDHSGSSRIPLDRMQRAQDAPQRKGESMQPQRIQRRESAPRPGTRSRCTRLEHQQAPIPKAIWDQVLHRPQVNPSRIGCCPRWSDTRDDEHQTRRGPENNVILQRLFWYSSMSYTTRR